MSNGVLIGASSHPVVIKVLGSSGGGLPGTGDNSTPLLIALAILIAGLACVAFSLRAKARQRKEARRLTATPLLAGALVIGLIVSVTPLTASAALQPLAGSGSTINITIDKNTTKTANVEVTVDGFIQTNTLYLDITAALQKEFPGVTFSINGDTFDHAGNTATKHVSDPQNQNKGQHALTLTATINDDLAAGTYTGTVDFSIIDKRTLLSVDVTPQDRIYDGTKNITAAGTPTLRNVATGDQVFLSNPSYTVVLADAGTDKDVEVQGTLTGDDAFKYVLAWPWGGVIPSSPITVDITPKPITFTGTLSYEKAYDGTDAVDLTGLQITNPTSFSGLIGSDAFTLSAGGITSAVFADMAAGTNKSVTYTGAFSLSNPQNGALASNYVLTPPAIVGTIHATAPIDDSIKLETEITAPNQKVTVNKYFANAHTVDWGDGSPVEDVTAHVTHTYATTGTYTVTLVSALTGQGFGVWTFGAYGVLIPIYNTTASSVIVSYIPAMTAFMTDATTAPDNFFYGFNTYGALTSLPAGSFDTSNVTTVGGNFFANFNSWGPLTSLPAGSFDISNITTVGNDFFHYFNQDGHLTSLPADSFDTSNITTVGDNFFDAFNASGGRITSLPDGSFDISNITTVGRNFFHAFNYSGALTSLPTGSFDTSNITTVGNSFFETFNCGSTSSGGPLTSLPAGSFRFNPGLTTVGGNFFNGFNEHGALTSLPDGSFDTSNITTVGFYFFHSFNSDGALTSLPAGSFDISSITTTSAYFFSFFASNGSALTSLPDGSFRFGPGLTTTTMTFFYCFNYEGNLTSLPAGSFDTSNITTAGESFFSSFNNKGTLASLPAGSFDTSNVTTTNGIFFETFNYEGSLTSLPTSFKWPKLSAFEASRAGNFSNAFYSPAYTLDRSAQDIINGCTTPTNDRNTFSSNQPGYATLDPNWQH